MKNLYALLLVSMTLDEAKTVLGLPPGGSPSHEEIQKAYRQKALQNHPDRGGDNAKMVEVNVAKDILEGKERPTYDRTPSPPSGGSAWSPGPRRPPPPDNVVTFDEAKGVAGIPSDVDWLFVTDRQRERGNYSGDESSSSRVAFVAYGQTDSKHVFAAAQHRFYEAYYVGGGPKTDVWVIKSLELPRKEGEKVDPSFLAGGVTKALKLVGFEGKFNFKVIPVKGKGWKFDDKPLTGSAMSIKHVMVDLGLAESDDPSVAARKQVVEMQVNDSRTAKPGYYPDGRPSNFYQGKYTGEYYQVTLFINGREFDLNEQEFTKFSKMRLEGKRLFEVIFGEYMYSGSKKVLTRLRKGKLILQWLAENVQSIPVDAQAALEAAAKQMK